MTLFGPQPGTLHHYAHGLTAFEFSTDPAANVLLFVGGLTNGLLDVPYVPPLAAAVSAISTKSDESWSLIQVLLTSSYSGWGLSSLAKDTRELARAIEYLRSPQGGQRRKIVLMGHSTGSQDTMEYLTQQWHKEGFSSTHEIDGGILQACVSDCEGNIGNLEPNALNDLLLEIETEYISTGKEQNILPQKFRDICWGFPITAYRFYSLFKPRQDDDYFSSTFTEEDLKETFGKVDRPILVLYGSKDEFVPRHVDKQKLITSWEKATPPQFWSPLSKVIQGASHDVGPKSDSGAQSDLINTVVQFLSGI